GGEVKMMLVGRGLRKEEGGAAKEGGGYPASKRVYRSGRCKQSRVKNESPPLTCAPACRQSRGHWPFCCWWVAPSLSAGLITKIATTTSFAWCRKARNSQKRLPASSTATNSALRKTIGCTCGCAPIAT